MERRLAAIMAGDVVGYSRLMADDEAGTYDRLRAGVDEVVVPSVEAHGGRVFKTTGDGFLAVFGSAGEALDAAVAIQDGFAGRPLQLRIGLNLGDVIQEGGDVFGDGVNVAARLEAMAEPGGVYASVAVVRSIGKRPDLHFARLGHRRGKNLPDPIEVHALRRGPAGRAWLGRGRAMAAAAALALVIVGAAAWRWGAPLVDAVAQHLPMLERAIAANADNRPSVAVLPFDNLSGDPGQGYFSDGLSEDIITELARNRELMVIARNSTFAFKDRPTDIREVGAKLGARYVVEGSTRRAGDQLRVVAQLIDASTGSSLVAELRPAGRGRVRGADRRDPPDRGVPGLLCARFGIGGGGRAADRFLQAYELVLQGRARYQRDKADPAAAEEARLLFARAVALDPGYAAAHAQLGLMDIVEYMNGVAREEGGGDLAAGLAQAREAIRLESDLALAYQVLSYGLAESGDYQGGLQAAERAVELNPSDPDSLMALAKAQVRFGSYDEAVANAALARRLHPMAPSYYPYVHGQALYAAGREEEAQEVMAECLLDTPREANCLRIEAVALVRLDRVADAREVMARLTELDPGFSVAVERRLRRFGVSLLMERYLADLAAAGAPRGLDQVAMPRASAA